MYTVKCSLSIEGTEHYGKVDRNIAWEFTAKLAAGKDTILR